jgi:hypothetical protein
MAAVAVGASFRRGWARLSAIVHARPTLAAGCAGAFSGAIGDGLAQLLEKASTASADDTAAPPGEQAPAETAPMQLDWRRLFGVSSFGCFCSAAMYVPFYRLLDQRIGTAVTASAVGLKVLLDDAIFVPLVEIPTL